MPRLVSTLFRLLRSYLLWLPAVGLLCGFLLGALVGATEYLRLVDAMKTQIVADPGESGGPVLRIQPAPALALLEGLPVKVKETQHRYDRSSFGTAWADVDRNGCDTRNDILRRDLLEPSSEAESGSECVIGSGLLRDPYTGQEISFRRGGSTSAQVQIDHVVALSDAWRSGAAELSAERRLALANDPLNLLAVDGPANRRKSDADAAAWLPQEAFRCHYVARQVSVKASYGLWVDSGERAAMLSVLRSCPETMSMPSAL
ncbi:HNH endonuclease family protein [Acaricomes phytoseiuli]|uniref:HNH endonuclease family protein n=1 Tax=Acaricomes phytoseiuli TaxID=291968 RepID=UPI00036AEA4C|nr:HNH endonuclease family protein [Acaricomes phytoseiuli]